MTLSAMNLSKLNIITSYICFYNTFHLKVRKGTKKNALVQIFKTQMHYFFIFVTETGIFGSLSFYVNALQQHL